MRRAVAATVPAVLAALLAGCAGIPTSGRVVEGEAVGEPQRPVPVRFEANPPVPGADEEGIVQGYLDAMASYERDYPIARQFLAPDAAAAWEPGDGMTIYTASTDAVTTDRGQVRLTMTVQATITPDLGYVRKPARTTEDFELALEEVEGEWRIANPPAGLLVSDQDFESEFRAYNRYFFDPDFEVLVPDPVYLPVQGSETTLLAEALLRGPSGWLAPAVQTAFPDNTRLGVPVTLEAGRASVELTAEATTDTSDEQRERMAAQLAWTLEQVEPVQQVSVTAGRVPLTDVDVSARAAESFGRYDPAAPPRHRDLYAATEDGVVVGDGLTPVPGPLGATPGIRELAVDPSGGRAAVVDATGTQLIWAPFEDGAAAVTLATGAELVAVSWDRSGLLWAVDQTPGGSRVLVTQPGAEAMTLPADDFGGRRIDDLAVSFDATRVALLAEGRVLIGIVLRDPDQDRAVRVEGLRSIELDDRTVTDLAWAGPAELVVLARDAGAAPAPFRVGLASSVRSPAGVVPGAVSLTAATGQGLAVGTDGGLILRQNATLRWVELGAATAPAYPG
ncbi:MAG: LpqB family beta-propeller domain-containing protein [Jiangellaceae bacterium]